MIKKPIVEKRTVLTHVIRNTAPKRVSGNAQNSPRQRPKQPPATPKPAPDNAQTDTKIISKTTKDYRNKKHHTPQNKKSYKKVPAFARLHKKRSSRGERIRTSDPLLPKQMR